MIVMVDQQRRSPKYEDPAIVNYLTNLPARKFFLRNSVHFVNHYVSTVACSPSRGSIFTGHYPSLHGVSQVDGVGKSADDPGIHWLGEATVPTAARYLLEAGYNVLYKGKWHISHRDILVPGSASSIVTLDSSGNPDPVAVAVYRKANMLSSYGFDAWIGNEPHGSLSVNTGTVRDPSYAFDTFNLIGTMEANNTIEPFFLVVSFVNPHDISVYPGLGTYETINASTAPVPTVISPPPTLNEDMTLKPRCQASFRATWDFAIIVGKYQKDGNYTRSYYFFQTFVDTAMNIVLQRLRFSRFWNNTIVLHFADHGEMLLAHGGMVQKWANSYEEATHIDLYVYHKDFAPRESPAGMFTTHVDLLPTLLGLAGVNCAQRETIRQKLAMYHTEARPLVGTDLSAFIWDSSASITTCNGATPVTVSLPNVVYFFSDDDPTRGDQQVALGYAPALQPNAYETIVGQYNGQVWKYVFYHDGTQLLTTNADRVSILLSMQNLQANGSYTDFELYNLNVDPYEQINLLSGSGGICANTNTTLQPVCSFFSQQLISQRQSKALVPTFQNAPRCLQVVC